MATPEPTEKYCPYCGRKHEVVEPTPEPQGFNSFNAVLLVLLGVVIGGYLFYWQSPSPGDRHPEASPRSAGTWMQNA